MFQRKATGSVVCPSCGSLVGVRDDTCYSCGRSNPGLWGFGPLLRQLGADFGFVPVVIGASSVLFVLTLLTTGASILRMSGLFSILSPNVTALFLFGASGAVPVFTFNRWWTILSAGWLHGGLLHILFNMYYVRMFVPWTTDVIGPSRTVIIYVVSGATGFLMSSIAGYYLGWLPSVFRGAGFTVGASAPIFGLLGALVHYGRTGSSAVKQQALSFAIPFFLFGLIMPGVDNYAHAGGFIGGYATSAFLNPMTRERGDHLLIAAVCLLASLLAVAASVLTGFTLFQ